MYGNITHAKSVGYFVTMLGGLVMIDVSLGGGQGPLSMTIRPVGARGRKVTF